MSAAADIRAALLAHAPLVALVASRVRQDYGDDADAYPFVVVRQVGNNPIRGLNGELHAREETFQIESWAETRAAAMQLHALVEAALLADDVECDPADPDAIDPEVWARACIWTVRIWT